MLGHLRVGPSSLRGRQYPEPAHAYRNDFQRDRDRIIHARAFRRLEGKTQVFAPSLCDHFRNRLTHTIEVSQVARTVASALGLNEELTETLALAHDLGHPPFAHVAEKELDRQMRRFGASFEHNRHALRIVDHLETRYARFDGLNLTFEVREGIVKHSREISGTDDAELQDLNPNERPPLEAQLIDLADEIAYNTADIDDAYSLGLFTSDQIGETVPGFVEVGEKIDTQFPGLSDRVRFWEIMRELMGFLITGLIEGTAIKALQAKVASVHDVRALPYRLAGMTEPTRELNGHLRNLLVKYVYSSVPLVEERRIAVDRVAELFDYLLAHLEDVPASCRDGFENHSPYRAVCDYVAGMTDSYFIRTYRKFLG